MVEHTPKDFTQFYNTVVAKKTAQSTTVTVNGQQFPLSFYKDPKTGVVYVSLQDLAKATGGSLSQHGISISAVLGSNRYSMTVGSRTVTCAGKDLPLPSGKVVKLGGRILIPEGWVPILLKGAKVNARTFAVTYSTLQHQKRQTQQQTGEVRRQSSQPQHHPAATSWLPLSHYVPDDRFAYDVVKEISDPKYKGRQPGTQDYTAAAQYVAKVFQQLGLVPVGDSGSFLQAYRTGLAWFAAMPTLTVNGKHLTFLHDFKVHGMSDSGTLTGDEVVYVGNGYSSDYAGLDVRGKIVAFTDDTTGAGSPTGVIDRAEYAKSQGASGVLIISGAMYPISSFERPLRYENSGVLAFYISPEVAKSVGINLSSPSPQTVFAKVQGTVQITRVPDQISYNVLGMIPGKDPSRTVMVEANLDGYGALPDGTVFPGASADSSGVGDLAGLAEYYRSLKTQPDVNILFAAIGSECYDRAGIRWFLQHRGNVGQIVADINLYDVGGTEDQKYLAVNSKYTQLDAAAKFAVKLDPNPDQEVHDADADTAALYNFDNAQMDAAGIPNVFIRTCESTEDAATDTFSNIKQKSLRNSMAIAKQLIFYLSAVTDPPAAFDPSKVQQVNVPEVGHTMSMVETSHFQVYYEPQFAQAIPGLVPMLDQLWDEDEWWNYNPNIARKIRIYLVTSSKEGWATAHRTSESTNEMTGGIQSPGNYSVSVVMPGGA
ncbi:hypothetical protein GCM10010885_20140 [Alicyclobacillus cellulosilyticus]|uniref:Peptidase M28 domain-containing protein n=1 Tax=Alicyclobacillus cellulosilyticus TaxID=1003997 RepID=A0A917NMC7_9BACL|nr:hypothetical protein GCM10010885_20140 [Alicyclobacillus cellulosilyticus]